MRALVVYESMYGNTRHIAEAVASGLRWSLPTDVILAKDAGDAELDDVELLIVGGPTHAWGLSSKRTREGARQDAAKHPDHLLESAPMGPGVREWLQGLKRHAACPGAAFDTRFAKPQLFTGSAARGMQRALTSVGFTTASAPHSFKVTGMAGPLAPGEIERAEQWGEEIGRAVVKLTEVPVTSTRSAR
jgi:hypothetical protein